MVMVSSAADSPSTASLATSLDLNASPSLSEQFRNEFKRYGQYNLECS